MKACMGTGYLALPFAAKEGGLFLFVIGILVLAAWSLYCVQRLCDCLKYLPAPDDDKSGADAEVPHRTTGQPPEGTATFGRVAWYAFGKGGLEVVDAAMLLLLMGIAVAYTSAILGFLADTPFSLGRLLDAAIAGAVLILLSLVPDIGFLSNASAIGLLALLASVVIIAGYGLQEYEASNTAGVFSSLSFWPESLSGVSRWFGCLAFGFGVAPLTYNFRESMREPDQMVPATGVAFGVVAIAYIAAGLGLFVLFPGVTGEVLHELPPQGIVPLVTRLAMVWVALTTAPLLLVPCAELLEGKWRTQNRVAVRVGIVGLAVIVAVLLPSFVQALAIVGCACVGVVGFCLPPLFHLRLSYRSGRANGSRTVLVDSLLLVWGCVATIVSTWCIFGVS